MYGNESGGFYVDIGAERVIRSLSWEAVSQWYVLTHTSSPSFQCIKSINFF